MIIDKVTLNDLTVFDGQNAVFHLLNKCTSQQGSQQLLRKLQKPATSFETVLEEQKAVRFWTEHAEHWPKEISNGTLVMIEKYYEIAESAPEKPNNATLFFSAIIHKLFNKDVYSFVRFSISHLIDFLNGIAFIHQLEQQNPPLYIQRELDGLQQLLNHPLGQSLLKTSAASSQKTLLALSYRVRRDLKSLVLKSLAHYAKLDAYRSMAIAGKAMNWTFPEMLPSSALEMEFKGLFHPLLKEPVPYDLKFSKEKNFLFLTGANMSGKSTLLRSMGIAALLAHMGMSVPAKEMKMSFLEGIITNMQVEDNILLGESYFFAEVQRMKLTAEKLHQSQYHLVLMDELFKGTNVHDAYECSHAVIKGLLQQEDNLMALSTHLNELSEDLEKENALFFKYCYTDITESGEYKFSYQLRDGVSKDRIGFLVLKKAGVLDLLSKDTEK